MHTTENTTTDQQFTALVVEALDACPTYEALAEAFRAGTLPGNGRRALIAGRRRFGMHKVAANMRRANERGTDLGGKVARSIADAYRYTDADLDARIARGEDAAPGPYREAVLLRTLATPEGRRATVTAARRFLNGTPDAGRWSDAVRSCLTDGARVDAQVLAGAPA